MESFKSFLESKLPEANGTCFVDAYRLFQTRPNAKLVHGLVSGQGRLKGIVYNHAWLLDGDLVIDPSQPKGHQEYTKSAYYRAGKIKVTFEYTYDEMLKRSGKFMTYGPWEKILLNNPY